MMLNQAVPKLTALAIVVTLLAGCSSRLPLERAPLPFRQAEDSFKLGHYDRAAHGYRIYIDSNQTPELLPRAYFRLAQSQFRLGNHDDCLTTLDELQRRYPDEQWRQVFELRGDAEYARGNAVSAVLFWDQALEVAERPRKVLIRRRIADAVARMDQDSLAGTHAVLSEGEARQLVAAAMNSGGVAAARPTSKPRAGVAVSSPSPRASAGIAEVGSGRVKVGLLLPLSGNYAAYGESSRRGIELAFADSGIDLVVRDTQGEAHLARAAVDELAADPAIVAVIGPLRSKVAQAVTPRAERVGLPLLSLAQRKSISGRYVLQTAMTEEMQASQLASYAMGQGLRRFGVLFPRDGYGSALSDAFQAEIKRRGGRIVGALAYEPGSKEFSVEVLSVQRWIDADDMQAVFIPDFATTAATLARELRDVRPSVLLLGSNGWNEPGQLGAVAESLSGAVFVDGFFIGSQRAATQTFIAAFRSYYEETPSILEAQAYDAARLARQVLEAPGPMSREGFISGIQSVDGFAGAAGDLTFGANGVERELFVLRLEGRRIQEILGGRPGGESSLTFAPPSPVVSP